MTEIQHHNYKYICTYSYRIIETSVKSGIITNLKNSGISELNPPEKIKGTPLPEKFSIVF